VRPLLSLTRVDTEAGCHEAGVTPLLDPTNRQRAHKRNRIRHDVLPLLRRENPQVDDALARLAASVAEDLAYIDAQAAQALARVARRDRGAVRIDRRSFARLPRALQARVVQLAFAGAPGGASLSAKQIAAVIAAMSGPAGARLDLPRGLRAEVRRDALVIEREPRETRTLPARAVTLPVPGAVAFGPWRISAEVVARPRTQPPAADALEAWVDAEAAGDRLTVRRRRAGDRFQPLGMSEAKKLQDFFVDAHVERAQRDATPLVCAKAGVLWVAGHRIAEWARVRPGSGRIVRLRAERRA
jgi:tRNA(Ile)-lysidine synthase